MDPQDFLVLHPDAASKLYETWLPVYAEKILQVARLERKLELLIEQIILGKILLKWFFVSGHSLLHQESTPR